jgi:hypothetical protein
MQSRPDRESARAKFRAEVDPALQAISASDSARVQLRDSLHSYLKATPPVEQAQEYLAWTPQPQSSTVPVDLLVGDADTLLVVHPISPPAIIALSFFLSSPLLFSHTPLVGLEVTK